MSWRRPEPDRGMDDLRRLMAGWGRGAQQRFSAKDSKRFDAMSEKRARVGRLRDWPRFDDAGPAVRPASVLAEGRPRRGVREDLAATGRKRTPGPATAWFEASVSMMVMGFFYQLLGALLARFVGFGGFFVTLGVVMSLLGFIGIILTPVVWLIGMAMEGLVPEKAA